MVRLEIHLQQAGGLALMCQGYVEVTQQLPDRWYCQRSQSVSAPALTEESGCRLRQAGCC